MRATVVGAIVCCLLSIANSANAQFKDLPESVGRITANGVDIGLWKSQQGNELYFIPYINMDWHHFVNANKSVLNADLNNYCSSNIDMEEGHLWDIRIDLYDEALKEAIVTSWNTSDKPFIYAKYFNNGIISSSSLQLPPIIGYKIAVSIPGMDPIIIKDKIIQVNGEIAISSTIQNPYFDFVEFTNAQLCAWWKRRKTTALEGYLLIEGVDYDNTILSRTAALQMEKVSEGILSAEGSRAVEVPDLSEDEIKAIEGASLTIVGAAAAAGVASFPPAAPIVGVAAAISNGFVKYQSAKWRKLVTDYEDSTIIISNLSEQQISELTLNVSDSIRIQAPYQEGLVGDWLDGTQEVLTDLMEQSTLRLRVETDDSVAKFYDRTGELLLELESVEFAPGVDETIAFQIFSSSDLTATLDTRMEVFRVTGTSVKPVAMTPLSARDYQIEDWFLERFENRFEAESDRIGNAAEAQLELEKERFERLTEKLQETYIVFEAETNQISNDASRALDQYSSKVQDVSLASDALTDNFDVPTGTIIWWHPPSNDAAIPKGWAVADGSEVVSSSNEKIFTPNLIGSGIIGGVVTEAGNQVGTNVISISEKTEGTKLSISQMPSHTHTFKYQRKLNFGLESWFPGGSLDVRDKDVTDAKYASTTSSTGRGQSHDHAFSISFDNRSQSIILIPLMKL